jgi:uncharacterized protein (TIGR02996 family)
MRAGGSGILTGGVFHATFVDVQTPLTLRLIDRRLVDEREVQTFMVEPETHDFHLHTVVVNPARRARARATRPAIGEDHGVSMSRNEEHLLAQIRANPHDDQLRLVYADALLARGDERGEYIALAIQAHVEHGKLPPEWYGRLRALEQRESMWAEELGCAGFSVVSWRRGLPFALVGSVQAFITHHDVLQRLPIESISFSPGARDLAALAALPSLAFVEEITLPHDARSSMSWTRGLVYDPLPRAELAALCASPNLGALRKLSFDTQALSEDTADVLGSSAVLARLEVLSLGGIQGIALERALAGKQLPRLKELAIWKSQLRDTGGRAFASCALPVLQHLRLERADLVEGAPFLLGSNNLATVQTLSITWDQLIDDGAVALGESPYPRALREVSFEHSLIETNSVIALARGTAMPFSELVTLELQECSIEDAGAIVLAGSTRFPRLTKLDLSSNRLTRDGAIAFASPAAIPTLTSLGIGHNSYPSGTFENEMEVDQGMELGFRTVEVPLGMDAIRSWFADRPGLRVF